MIRVLAPLRGAWIRVRPLSYGLASLARRLDPAMGRFSLPPGRIVDKMGRG